MVIVTRESIVGWIDLSKEVMEGLLVEVILRVNQEDKVLLIEQERVEKKHSRKREGCEQRSCGQREYDEYERLK